MFSEIGSVFSEIGGVNRHCLFHSKQFTHLLFRQMPVIPVNRTDSVEPLGEINVLMQDAM